MNKINYDELGLILIHEHVFNLYPNNCKTASEEYTLTQLSKLKDRNVDFIVDLTPYANINNYSYILENAPVDIISCIGYFTGRHVSQKDKQKSVEELYKNLKNKYLKGVGKKRIKPHIIKIATNTEVIKEYEKKFIQAAINLSNEYSLPIAFHCPKNTYKHFIELLSMGINPKKLMVCHYEKQYNKLNEKEFIKEALEIVSRGSYLQINDFGSKKSFVKTNKIIEMFMGIIENGYIDKLLISSDCNWRWHNKSPKLCSGNMDLGYTYLFDYTIPLLLNHGVSKKDIEYILTFNTRYYLFKKN